MFRSFFTRGIFAATFSVTVTLRVALAQSTLPEPARATSGDAVEILSQQSPGEISPAQISYALGRSIGSDLRRDGVSADLKSLTEGLMDGFEGNPSKWDDSVLNNAMEQLQLQLQQKAILRHQQVASKNLAAAERFLTQNRRREGVTQTTSGLQYEVLKEGNGPSPTVQDIVTTHYRGTLLDGTQFDSSYQSGRPAEFLVGQVIPGWTEALQEMRVGDKWKLFIPPELAYGTESPGPPIEPNSMLIFEIELLGIRE